MYIWIDLLNWFSSKLYRKNNTAVECQRFLPQIIHCTYPYDLSLVTKWTKDYPGSPVKPSMSERGPAEWDGHWVGESHRKTKLTFQRTGTLSVLFFPMRYFSLYTSILKDTCTCITYLQRLKKYPPMINLTVHICK